MTGWTKGPWVAHGGTTTGMMVSAPGATKARLAVCRNGGPDRKANAQLIAAAPELYEALELARTMINSYNRAVAGQDYEDMGSIDAALAKARGEHS